jgi:ribosomal protein S18 acetylase RimI-like enzyme
VILVSAQRIEMNTISKIVQGEEQEVLDLVRQVFDSNVAASYSIEGNQEFYKYLRHEGFLHRIEFNHQVFVAKDSAHQIVGAVEIRDSFHISLLFVRDGFQRSGIGRALVEQAIKIARAADAVSMTVNSSPNAVGSYESFGFRVVAEEQIVKGIRYIPMALTLR